MIHWQKYVDVERSNDVTLGEAFDKVPSASWNLLISSLFENKIGKKKGEPDRECCWTSAAIYCFH